jgi:very-short-patch-repair endonuclease
VLAHHELGSTRTETELEERFLHLLRASGLPLPRCQAWIGRFRVDFLWPAERVVAEADGPVHRARRRQALDADRDAELERRGYATVRVDEAEINLRPDLALARVTAALSARRPSPAG